MGKNPDSAYSLQPAAPVQVDLPIDHFRLLGVSPSAESETILRTLQLRRLRLPPPRVRRGGLPVIPKS